jgi:predicted peptidase
VWVSDDAKTKDGPLVFYWHGATSAPGEAFLGVGANQIDAIKKLGGMVVSLEADPDAGILPWFYTAFGTRDDDLIVADEVLGCAVQNVGIDVRRIHSMGMSAGGLNTAQMSYRRSGYIACVVLYSGGLLAQVPAAQDPENKVAAMIFHGGPTDTPPLSFPDLSNAYLNDLKSKGHFAFICNHNSGHTIPIKITTSAQPDARPSILEFFLAHPFGTVPSPYANALPAGFPDYCALPAPR